MCVYKMEERLYIILSGFYGFVIVGVPISFAYHDTWVMWLEEGRLK
jgi:hypothetical protein